MENPINLKIDKNEYLLAESPRANPCESAATVVPPWFPLNTPCKLKLKHYFKPQRHKETQR